MRSNLSLLVDIGPLRTAPPTIINLEILRAGAIAAFGPDGRRMVIGADDGTATLLAAAGQGAATTRLTSTPDGRHLALLGGQELSGIQLHPYSAGPSRPDRPSATMRDAWPAAEGA